MSQKLLDSHLVLAGEIAMVCNAMDRESLDAHFLAKALQLISLATFTRLPSSGNGHTPLALLYTLCLLHIDISLRYRC